MSLDEETRQALAVLQRNASLDQVSEWIATLPASEVTRLIEPCREYVLACLGMRGRGRLTLGGLSSRLASLCENHGQKSIRFDNGHPPTRVTSYRGFYEQAALAWNAWGDGEPVTVQSLAAEVLLAIGNTYEGYKGGTYLMSESSPVWAAPWGEASSLAILDAVVLGDEVVILTKHSRGWE